MRKIPPTGKKAQDAPNAIPERRKTAKTVDVDVGSIVQHIYQIHWGCHETAVGGGARQMHKHPLSVFLNFKQL